MNLRCRSLYAGIGRCVFYRFGGGLTGTSSLSPGMPVFTDSARVLGFREIGRPY